MLVWLIAGSVLLLSTAGAVWWTRVQTDPERVFWGMLEQSLRTNGVTVQSSQDDFGANVTYTLQYSLGGNNLAQSMTRVEQQGTKLTTEVIGTPDADYTRYVDIETDETNEAGDPIDVSAIENVWAKTEHTDGTSGLIGQAALGLNLPLGALPVPIANLPAEQRESLLDQMRRENIYQVSYDNVSRQRSEDGRLLHVYNAQIQAILYASLMKQFGEYAGLQELVDLDPNTHSGAPPLEVEMTVDVRSRQLVDVRMASSGGMYHQTYSGYDIPVQVQRPNDTVSGSELQHRLQEL